MFRAQRFPASCAPLKRPENSLVPAMVFEVGLRTPVGALGGSQTSPETLSRA